jgi:hypothetical protein
MSRTEVVPKGRYTVYLSRAEEFEEQMVRAASQGAWNSIGLLGVHCVISGCDALTVRLAGQRWSGQDHAGVYGVVSSLNLPGASVALRQISNVLDQKNRIEYEARAFSRAEATEVSQAASRFLSWVRSRVK